MAPWLDWAKRNFEPDHRDAESGLQRATHVRDAHARPEPGESEAGAAGRNGRPSRVACAASVASTVSSAQAGAGRDEAAARRASSYSHAGDGRCWSPRWGDRHSQNRTHFHRIFNLLKIFPINVPNAVANCRILLGKPGESRPSLWALWLL